MGGTHYRDLVGWQRAMTLAEACYRITKEFPRDELFAMSNQIRRASTSIAANIAEGQARGGKKEFLRFLRVARGSLAELETLLTLSQNVGLLTREAANPTVAC